MVEVCGVWDWIALREKGECDRDTLARSLAAAGGRTGRASKLHMK